jgi:uncharacterized protein YqfA (UPF0365 family)
MQFGRSDPRGSGSSTQDTRRYAFESADEQAAADLRVAQAHAEKRRALAVAQEQEMKALVEENHAKVVLAEAEVPMAIAHAFRDGHLTVMNYYNLKNLQSDTEMRNAIAIPGKGDRNENGPNDSR